MNIDDLESLASEMSAIDSGLEIKNRRYLFRTYQNCFIGKQI